MNIEHAQSSSEPVVDRSAEFFAALEAIFESGLTDQAKTAVSAKKIKKANFQAIVQLHELVSEQQLLGAKSVHSDLCSLLGVGSSGGGRQLSECAAQYLRELVLLLDSPHWKCMANAHDDIANRRFEPILPEIPHEVDEDEGVALKIVRLVRNKEPLGATIKCEPDGTVLIARVMKAGVADRSACIQVGDRVIEVNSVPVTGKQPAEIVKLLSDNNKTVTFKLVPSDLDLPDSADDSSAPNEDRLGRVRALFDYTASDDPLHPCPEAALNFKRGDILQLVDDRDEHWWQARKHNTTLHTIEHIRVGLIPSTALQERRTCRTENGQWQSCSQLTDTHNQTRHRPRQVMFNAHDNHLLTHSLSYEPVALLHPRHNLIRPIVLVGPAGVGRNELQRRLLMLNADHYGATVPHTSRAPKSGEVDGVDYQFVSKEQMEHWVQTAAFIEYGEYKGNIYGTLAQSVQLVMQQGRTPVLTPHPQALKLLCTPVFRPYVIFVKPPPFATLKETRGSTRARSLLKEGSYERGFSDEELQSMLQCSEQLDQMYGHLFDYTLTNGNLEFAFRELCEVVRCVDTTAQWVPLSWLP